jgi:DME family drug/metabolite transporter
VLPGLLLVALAAVTWGTTGAVTTVLVRHAGAEPLVIGAARLLLGACLLFLGAGVSRHPVRVAPGDRLRCALMGVALAVYQATYFTAVTLAGIVVAALVAICSAPLMVALLAAWLLGEPLTGRVLAALGSGVTGTALLLAAPGPAAPGPPSPVAGGGLALAAGLAYAGYVVAAKGALARSAPLPLTALAFAAGAVLLLPTLVWTRDPLGQAARGWPWLLYLGAVATAGAYALYTLGLRRIPAVAAGVVTLLEPLTATSLGTLVFGEPLRGPAVLGAILLLGAFLLILLPARRAPTSPAAARGLSQARSGRGGGPPG